MASNCNGTQEAVVDSGVDSEATTPSSPEDDPHEHDGENSKSAVCPASTCKTRTESMDESASAHRCVLISFCQLVKMKFVKSINVTYKTCQICFSYEISSLLP